VQAPFNRKLLKVAVGSLGGSLCLLNRRHHDLVAWAAQFFIFQLWFLFKNLIEFFIVFLY